MAHPDHILYLISRLQEQAFRFLSRELGQRGIQGIEPSHGAIIRQLEMHGSLSMSQLAKLIDRTKPTVTVLVRKLEKNGYVTRIPDPTDGRVTKISLTEKTKALADDLQEVSLLMIQIVYLGLSDTEQQDFVDRLENAALNFTGE